MRRRNLVVAAVLAVLIGVVQVLYGNPVWAVLLSAGVAFVLSLLILRVSDRYSRRD